MSFSPSPQQQHRCNDSSIKYSREQQQQQPNQHQHSQQMQMSSYVSMLERASSAHLYAQKLNNISSMCIEIGHYDKAISSLGKALRLIQLHNYDQLLDPSQACMCHECSLDGCITFSESNKNNSSLLLELCNSNIKTANKNTTRTHHINTNMMFVDNEQDQDQVEGEHTTTSTIYRRPIRIPPRSISEGHNMGSTLFLLITFNLAMAHHLKAVLLLSLSSASASVSSSIALPSLIANTLKLYELTNYWQHRHSCEEQKEDHDDEYDSNSDDECDSIMTMEMTYENQDDDEEEEEETPSRADDYPINMNTMNATCSNYSVRFNMILYNNLSHLHQLTKNNTITKQCLEHLLSTIMLVVYQNNNISNTIATDAADNESRLRMQLLSSSSRFIDIQGFVHNTSSLILQDQCADAA